LYIYNKVKFKFWEYLLLLGSVQRLMFFRRIKLLVYIKRTEPSAVFEKNMWWDTSKVNKKKSVLQWNVAINKLI